jgi:hypothetical protein
VASDYEILVGPHDLHGTGASPCTDDGIVPRFPLAIDLDSEMLEEDVARPHRTAEALDRLASRTARWGAAGTNGQEPEPMEVVEIRSL